MLKAELHKHESLMLWIFLCFSSGFYCGDHKRKIMQIHFTFDLNVDNSFVASIWLPNAIFDTQHCGADQPTMFGCFTGSTTPVNDLMSSNEYSQTLLYAWNKAITEVECDLKSKYLHGSRQEISNGFYCHFHSQPSKYVRLQKFFR